MGTRPPVRRAARPSWRAVTTTAPTISAAPASVVGAGRSPRSSAPSATATSGFTYWWVTTCEIGACFRSQAYALKPTTDPMTARYAHAATGPGLERVRAELRCLAGDEPRADEHEPAAEHLVDRRDERVAGERQPSRDERAARPGERRREHHEQTDRDRSAADAAGADDEREADEADPGRQHRRAWDALARERPPDDDLQRHGACDHRCDAGVDPRLGDVHQADPARRAARRPDPPPRALRGGRREAISARLRGSRRGLPLQRGSAFRP